MNERPEDAMTENDPLAHVRVGDPSPTLGTGDGTYCTAEDARGFHDLGEPCESCGTQVAAPFARGGGRILVELPFLDGRTQAMPRHTPQRCRAIRAEPSVAVVPADPSCAGGAR